MTILERCFFYCFYHQFPVYIYYKLNPCFDDKYDITHIFGYAESLDFPTKI